MSKNKLLIAISAGVFALGASTGAFAQTSPDGASGAAMSGATAQPSDMTSGAKTSKHKMRKHSANSGGSKRTPAAETGNNAGATGGQSQ